MAIPGKGKHGNWSEAKADERSRNLLPFSFSPKSVTTGGESPALSGEVGHPT